MLLQFLLFWDCVCYKTVSVWLLQFLLFWDRVGYKTVFVWLLQFLLFWDRVGYKTVSVWLLQFLLFWDRVGHRASPRPGHHLPRSEARECAAGQGRCVCHRLCTYATNWLGNPLQLCGKCRDLPPPPPQPIKKDSWSEITTPWFCFLVQWNSWGETMFV